MTAMRGRREQRKLESELRAARKEIEQAALALAPKHVGGEMERFRAANDRCLTLV
jgi:hypothetical protein